MSHQDGTDKLCQAVYGRAAKASDYLGGSEARMLHDAADKITELKRMMCYCDKCSNGPGEPCSYECTRDGARDR